MLRSKFDDDAVVAYLYALGRSVDADRAYVFEYDADSTPDAVTTSQRFEWNSGSAEPQIDSPELQRVPMNTILPRWLSAFARREPIWGLVRNFPSSEREILEPQDIVSILVCPILTANEVWGFVGFDDCRNPRAWSPQERRILARASTALAAALRHQTLRQRLSVARQALRETVDAIDTEES